MEENVQQVAEPGIFDNYEEYVDASTGSRFLNFLIDNLFMNYVISLATGFVIGIILGAVAPDFVSGLDAEEGINGPLFFFFLMVSYLNYILYYTICETAFKGYTLGKLITGTKAIREDGQQLTFRNALLRSLARMIPFEPFSAFGNRPWHDSLTKTRVIKAR